MKTLKIITTGIGLLALASGPALAGSSSSSNSASSAGVSIDSHDRSSFASAAIAPGLTATAPCMGATSVGGAGQGFGFSFGTTWKDRACTTRENARYMTILTRSRRVGVRIMCTLQDIQDAVPDVCYSANGGRKIVHRVSSRTRMSRSK